MAADVRGGSPSRSRYRAVFLSPHYDDAVFSCGGLISQLASEGPILVLNVFSHYPAEVTHGSVVVGACRAQEEERARATLGFESADLGEIDAFLRRPQYRNPVRLFGNPVCQDEEWLPQLAARVDERLDALDYEALYAPLGIGWHVDHLLCHRIARKRIARDSVFFYEDAPYCLLRHAAEARLAELGAVSLGAVSKPPGFLTRLRALASSFAALGPFRGVRPAPLRWVVTGLVAFYFGSILRLRGRKKDDGFLDLKPLLVEISGTFGGKLEACARYESQFSAIFSDSRSAEQCYREYGETVGSGRIAERYWRAPG